MSDVIIFGAGAIAQVAKRYFDRFSADRLVGFTVDRAFLTDDRLDGLPVIAWEDLEQHFAPDDVMLLGPLSYRRMNEFRRDRYEEGKRRGYRFTSFIHPASHVMTDDIGENAFILEANVIQPFVRIGRAAMIWSGNHIGHHTTIGDYCFMASEIGLGSRVEIGDRCFIGGGSAIEGGVRVGDAAFIGSCSYIAGDVPAAGVVRRKGDPVLRITSDRLKRIL